MKQKLSKKLSKRNMFAWALALVLIFIWILFLLTFLDVMKTTWHNPALIIGMLIGIPLFLIMDIMFIILFNKKEMNYVEVNAKLVNKTQIGMLHRKIILWKYSYEVEGNTYNKIYWNLGAIRRIDEGDTFTLYIDEKDFNKAFFYVV